MTYLQFHYVFILPLLTVLTALGARKALHGIPTSRARWALPVIALIAFVYTTPWDNYLVYAGIWYYGSARVVGTIGYVPVEEYLFFLLQPVLTGLWLYIILQRPIDARPESGLRSRVFGALLFLACTVAGFAMLGMAGGEYMGLILAWACPVLAAMWAWKGHVFWDLRKTLLLALFPPTVYLWIADRIAIGLEVWTIDERTSTGILLLGLPIEEATFFLVTNLLCILGLFLLLNVWKAYPCSESSDS